MIRQLPDHTLGPNFPLTETLSRELQRSCAVCPHARMKTAPFSRNDAKPKLVTAFGDRVHMDLCGPLPPSNPHGFCYGSIFVDAYSLHLGAYCLRTKDEHVVIHKQYCADMANHGGMSIQHFHSDNGGEFCSKDYATAIRDQGALKTTTVPYTPNQNALAEGAFWKLFCMVRSFLIHSGMPKSFWAHAYLLAAYVLNRLPRIMRGGHVTSTYSILNNGRLPELRHIRVFGCMAHALIDKANRDTKLGDVAVTGFNLGPSRYQRGWHLWVPGSNKFIVTRTARFDEHILYKHATSVLPVRSPSADLEDDDSDDDVPPVRAPTPQVPPANQCRTPGCCLRLWHLGPCGTAPVVPADGAAGLPSAHLRHRGPPSAGVASPAAPIQAHLTKTSRTLQLGEQPQALYWADLYDQVGPELSAELWSPPLPAEETDIPAIDAFANLKGQKLTKQEDGTFSSVMIPRNYNDLEKSPQRDSWYKAMQSEYDSHIKAGTWQLVPADSIPPGRKTVGSTWAFDVKKNPDGSISRYKARFCAQGFSQLEGWDYQNTFSNTVRLETIRVILALAAALGLKLTCVDIVTAYLNGTLKEKVYMRQPRGFEQRGKDNEPLVCLLLRSIYGLKQSGACWEARLVSELIKIGFSRCEVDPCLFKLERAANAIIYVAAYVDDLVLASSSQELRDEVVQALRDIFDVKDIGDLTYVLGTAVHQDLQAGTVSLDQSLYIEEMMQTFLPNEMSDKKFTSLPCNDQILLLDNQTSASDIDPLYRRGVGKLNWLVSVSRPDLAYTLSVLGRFNNCGGAPHMVALYKAMRYAYGTRHYKLTFGAGRGTELFKSISSHCDITPDILREDELIVFTDASQGGARPMAGYVIWYLGGPISWSAYRLPHTTLSSCEAEYMAATRATTTTTALRALLEFTGKQVTGPTLILCDNISAVMLSESNKSSKTMKHIATRIAYLREAVDNKSVLLHHIRTAGMLADIFTKPLGTAQFHVLRRLLMPA